MLVRILFPTKPFLCALHNHFITDISLVWLVSYIPGHDILAVGPCFSHFLGYFYCAYTEMAVYFYFRVTNRHNSTSGPIFNLNLNFPRAISYSNTHFCATYAKICACLSEKRISQCSLAAFGVEQSL